MTHAAVRISRVRLKSGADLHILRSIPQSAVADHIRKWSRLVLNDDRPPDGYAAVAFWVEPDAPGRIGYNVGMFSANDAVPLPVLSRLAAAYLGEEASIVRSRKLDDDT